MVSLRVLSILVLPAGFFLSIKDHKLLGEVLILHSKLLSDLDESSQAVKVILIVFIDFLVNLKGFVKEVHPSIARGDHECPFNFFRLNLTSSFEVINGLLKHVLLSVVHTEARDNINLGRVVPEGFLVEVDGLKLILFLLVKIAHLGKDL